MTTDSSFRTARRGAALVEVAIVLSVLVTILFALFDFGLAILRGNALSDAARRAARAATLRGEQASAPALPLGPDEFDGAADAEHPIADVVRPWLFTMSPADVRVQAKWPDGTNELRRRVVIELTYEHHLMFTSLFGTDGWTLTAASTMRIEH